MHEIDRRRFLRIAGFAGLALSAPVLSAACGGDDDDDSPDPTSSGGGNGNGAGSTATVSSSGPLETKTLKVGYLPITDATPLLIAHANGYYKDAGLEVDNPTLFRSWPAIAEAFQAKQVDIVHMLMPTTVFMRFGQKVGVKVVAWNHMDGSGLTVGNNINSLEDLIGGVIAIPSYYSIHNVTLQALLRKANITPVIGDANAARREVKLVVMAPPDMPPAIANGSIGGYIVAEPFNAAAEVNKVGKMLRFTGDIWQDHACCVAIMHEDAIAQRPNWAQATVTALARAQLFANENREKTAEILSNKGNGYLPQPLEVIDQAMNHYDIAEYSGENGAIQHPDWPDHRIFFQPFPFRSYTEELVRMMKDTLVEGDAAFLAALDPAQAHSELVDDRMARAAIAELGGPAKFGLPDSLIRTEVVEP